jgi:uncharacterized protein (TIGR03437 family)
MNRHLSSVLLTLFLAVPLFLIQMRPLFAQSNFIHEAIRRVFEDCFGETRAERELQACAKIEEGSKSAPPDSPISVNAVRIEANLGQSDSNYPFLARGRGHYLFLNGVETAVDLRDSAGNSRAVLRMRLENARSSPGEGLEPLPHRLNYLIGDHHTTNVPVFAQVKFRQVYPGIDLAFYPNDGEFEHDFIVAPGADPSRIRLRFDGADSVTLNADGELNLRAGAAAVRWRRPHVYQEIRGRRVTVEGHYEMLGANRAGFRLGAYDTQKPLVIDPVISYLTYIGQAEVSVAGRSTVDAAGNIYLTGATSDGTWPATPGAATPNRSGFTPSNVFITKMNSAGTALLYSTFIGGTEGELGAAIAVDAQGNAYITGATNSTNYPTTPGALRTSVPPAGPSNPDKANCFLTKLNPAGSAIVYSTYLGGSQLDGCTAIALDSAGAAFVTGGTTSTDFPTTEGAVQQTYRLGNEAVKYDIFVSKLNPAGSRLEYSTYLGAGGNELGTSIAIDSQGNAYVTGTTTSANFPITQGAADSSYGGHGGNEVWTRWGDAFAFKLNPTGTQLVYSTYIGGNRDEMAFSIAVDAQGAAYVVGNTLSTDFFTTPNAYSRTFKGIGGEPVLKAGDAFAVKVNPDGRSFGYSTLLGGSLDDRALQVVVDRTGSAHIVGNTFSADFPITPDATQLRNRTLASSPSRLKMGNGFLVQLDPTGSRLVYGTFLGGTNNDWLNGVSVAADGAITVTGTTASSDLATTAGVYQRTFFGGPEVTLPLGDVFVARFADQAQPAIGGFVNAASYSNSAAPGMIAVIAGSNIGPDNLLTAALDANGLVATTLGETQVLVNNRPAPLVYVSKGQTSFIVPYETAVGANAQVVVDYKGVRSPAFSVPVVAASPGLFSANSSGTGQGAILNQDGGFNNAQNPAVKGSVIVLFLTGEGQTDPPGSDGQIANGVFPKPALPVRVDMGGIQAEVLYAGAAPGQVAGLMQVNAKIPDNSNSGPVPVQVTVGTAQSQRSLTVAVR